MKVLSVSTPGGLDNLKIVEKESRKPEANEVQIRWHATSLNYHDYLVAIGGIPVPDGRVPMSDGAGEVIAVGDQVKKWKVGDKVMSLFFPNWIDGRPTIAKTRAISGETVDGFVQEISCVNEDQLTSIPNDYSYTEAATLPCAALTAWRGLITEGQLQPGDKVLIEGTGGMSIFGAQLALAAGATVFATSSSPEKAARLKEMGVSEVINYKEDERWGKTIFKMTGGVDHVLDVGGGSTMQQSIEAAALDASVISIGILGNGRKGSITFPKFFFKHLKMTGIAVGSRLMQEQMVKALNNYSFRPIIDKSFPLEGLAEAFEYQASGAHFGKIVVEW